MLDCEYKRDLIVNWSQSKLSFPLGDRVIKNTG